MKTISFFLTLMMGLMSSGAASSQIIFDTHLHGALNPVQQVHKLEKAGVYKAALSTSWSLQNKYRNSNGMKMLYGLMFPCPNGKVPYSLQPCYNDGAEWPAVEWVEKQMVAGKIDFLGEVLAQYYGISGSDPALFPYYQLALKHHLPVGIHTGGAGPGHGSPGFKMEMGNPKLLEPVLARFPDLKIWLMHSGDQYYKEAIEIMKQHKTVYADISVISNPDILPFEKFSAIMKEFIAAGLEDRIMFGTDNADVAKVIKMWNPLPSFQKVKSENCTT